MGDYNYSYRDSRRLTRWTIGLCGATLFLYLLLMVVVFYCWALMGDILQPGSSSRDDLRSALSYLAPLSYCSVAAVLLTYLLFFVWLYRASANAHAMGADMSHGAGFSVGMFFVPGLNLFLPPLMMSELVRASANAAAWRIQPKSPIVAVWWALQLGTSLAGIVVSIGAPPRGAPLSDFRTYFWFILIFRAIGFFHYIVMAVLVRKVSASQSRQWDDLSPLEAAVIFS